MKIDKYTEILQEWSSSKANIDWKQIFSLDETIKESELSENLILYVTAKDTEGNPLLAEVRCYALDKPTEKGFDTSSEDVSESEEIWCGEMDGTDERINEAYHTGTLEFERAVTDETGYAVLFLQPGYYQVEVSKGSAYSVEAKRLHLEKSQTILQYVLKPIPKEEKEGWYAGDLHHHSVFSSRLYQGTDPVVETPMQIRNSMRAAGLDFGALSDHHNVFNHKMWLQTKTEDFTPILSKEISTSNGHVISLNVKEQADVIYQVPSAEERTDEYLRNEFIRITDEIRALGGMPQLNHPRDPQTAISWNPNFMDIITIFESVEIWNGSKPMVHGSSSANAVAMWIDMLEDGIYLPGTTGSDTHNIRCNDYMNFYRDTWKLAKRLRTWRDDTQEYSKEESRETNKDVTNKNNNDKNNNDKNNNDKNAISKDDVNKNIKEFLSVCDSILFAFEKWAKRNLSSGGVRTFVYTEKMEGADSLVKGIQNGHLSLSDGPMFFPVMMAEAKVSKGHQNEEKQQEDTRAYALPGDCVECAGEIQVRLTANRRLRTMRLLKKGRKMADYSLQPYEVQKDGYFEYHHSLTPQMLKDMGLEWQEQDYLVMVAFDDCTNIAIANPFLVGDWEIEYKRNRNTLN